MTAFIARSRVEFCVRAAALALTGFGILESALAASPFIEAAAQLDGEWRNTDYVLKVDAKRAQASVDPARPFEWDRFLVKEVAGDEVVFSVGAELFEARLDADTLVLTSTSFRGERTLYRGAGFARHDR